MAVYLISEKAVLWQVPNQPLEITPLGVLGEDIIYGNGPLPMGDQVGF